MAGRRNHGAAVVAWLVIASLIGGCAWLGFETADSVMKEGQQLYADKKYDEILGVHIIGPHATELIAEACVAMQLESTAEELGRTMHAHPTVSEAVMEAAEAVHDLAVHI